MSKKVSVKSEIPICSEQTYVIYLVDHFECPSNDIIELLYNYWWLLPHAEH